MICPRCSVGEISEATQECVVCGYSPTAGVLVDTPQWNDLEDPAVRSLDRQFRIEGVLRRGAISSVYLARDLVSGRLAALKVLPLTPQYGPDVIDRFRSESALAAALDHPHIVPVFHFGVTDTCLWYTMEHCQSRSLGEVLRAAGPMELRACLRLVEQVASALDYGHRRGVLHGSLKLSNVLVDADGWVRVADFGMHTAFGPLPPRKPDASIEESYGHVAPERFGTSPLFGPASDQYSLAILIYACLAGRQPFSGDTVEEIARAHLTTPPPRLADVRSGVPPHVTLAVGRALSKKAAERFPTILDFSTALAGVGTSRFTPAGTATPALPPPRVTPSPGRTTTPVTGPLMMPEGEPEGVLPRDRLPPPRPPRRTPRIAAGILLVAALGTLLWWWTSPGSPSAGPATTQTSSFPLDSAPPAVGPSAAPHAAPVEPPPSRAPVETTIVRRPTPPPLVATPQRPARLFINANPWGELSLDGQSLGNTPKADLQVTPGTHRISVTRDGFEPWERTVTVRPGEVLRLTDIVLRELKP
ncbi:MAG TPA: protein kinase [Gemmatimonadales bacterium]|nr:protein kinase [Gemmatimonadales bacterium]